MPLGDLINGSKVIANLRKWRQISKLSELEIERLQKKNLMELLIHTTENIPYYRQYSKYKSDDPKEWIKNFPVMKKTDISVNINQLTSKPLNKLIKKQTSGSSGVQGTTYMDSGDISLNRAIQLLWWEWSGWKMGTPIIQTGMTAKRGTLKTIKDLVLRTKYYIAYGLSDRESLGILKNTKITDEHYIGGYASSLYVLAKIAKNNKLSYVSFKGAISWGDKMFPHFRTEIREAFGCEVNDTYGCSEGLMIAAQKDLDYYYIMTPHVYLELVDSQGNEVIDGEIGYVVATRLDARSMPLVRYYTGDLAIKLPRAKYPEKRDLQFPLLEKVVGRDTDIVSTRSGKYMIVHFFTGIFQYVPEIKQFRVIQTDLDSITIEYIPSEIFNYDVLKTITEKIHQHLKEPFIINWLEVDSIPSTASGKPQLIKSFMENQI